MNVKALQRMDRWLGVPLCFFLTLARAAGMGGRPGDHRRAPRNVLLVKLAEQGSTVLAYQALKRAVEMAGRENVYFIAFDDNRFILDALGVIPEENVVTIASTSFPAIVRSALAALWRLRRLRLDAAVDMEFFARGSAAVTFLSGARRRAGFHAFFGAGPYRGNLMTHRLLYNPHLHTSDTFLSLVEALMHDPEVLPTFDGFPRAAGEPPQFRPKPQDVADMQELLRRELGGSPPLVLLNPNASDLLPLRRWPVRRYAELARRILERHPDVCIGLTGAPAEAEAMSKLASEIGSKRCVSLAGKTTLSQLLALYGLSKVLVTNDSGPAHFATLTPIQVVTLFGPETPNLFAARTPRTRILWAGVPCSPCVSAYNNRQSRCQDNICMQAITVEQVFAEVNRGLGK